LLAQKIRELIEDAPKIRKMSENCSRLASTNAAELVVEAMEKYSAAE